MAVFIHGGISSVGLKNFNYKGRPSLLFKDTQTSFLSVQRRNFNFKVRAAETDTNEVTSRSPDKAPATNAGSSNINQLLGMKGAAQEADKWKIRLQLTKPVTWAPLIWGVVCGAAASGNFHWNVEDVAKSLCCMILSGPFLTGYTQTLNDWYDREIDAINEPYRPIPSGAISESEVITQIWVLLLGGLGLAAVLDVWAGHNVPTVFYIAVGGSLLSYIYSAPPLKLKQNGWIGNFALGSSYICLPWWAGQALFGTLKPDIMVLTVLYSIAGLGIAVVNDFKSIEGDRTMGLQSLPVAFGVETAKWICVGAIDITQLSVAGYLFATGKLYYALALLGLVTPQVILQPWNLHFIYLQLQISQLMSLKFTALVKLMTSLFTSAFLTAPVNIESAWVTSTNFTSFCTSRKGSFEILFTPQFRTTTQCATNLPQNMSGFTKQHYMTKHSSVHEVHIIQQHQAIHDRPPSSFHYGQEGKVKWLADKWFL